ncbi:MAG: type II toxin-antitoxin system RelE/ParE family toxin [Clostridia bacterium]
MSKYRIRYTQQSVDDMDAIFDYIVIENRDAAIKLLQAFEESIGHLADTPYIEAALPTGDAAMIANGYRYLVVSPYMIFHRVFDGEVRIGRILHSRQGWLHLLFGLR